MTLTLNDILSKIPHGKPFRFVDEILEVNENGIKAKYTFRHDEFFYSGHFPNNPITPGVILVECMAQVCMTGLGFYLLLKEVPAEDAKLWSTLQTEITAEFMKPVYPGDTVTIEGKLEMWRRRKIKVSAVMSNDDGEICAKALLAGLGIRNR